MQADEEKRFADLFTRIRENCVQEVEWYYALQDVNQTERSRLLVSIVG